MSSKLTIRCPGGFFRDRSGNAVIMFGLAAVPFFGILGIATDYGLALADKAKLDGAADAASLAAIRVGQSDIQGGSSRTTAMSDGSAQALKTFRANAGSLAFGTVPKPIITWVTGSSGQTLKASVTYSMTMTNTFSKIIGIPTTTLSGTSVSTLAMPSYINYYIVTDISQSMGVGATTADMTNLYNRVIQYKNYDTLSNAINGIGCVFGCHVKTTTGYPQIDTNENLAHLPQYGAYINLRIDAAKSAIQTMINDAIVAGQQPQPNIIKIGIYTMQQDPTTFNSYIVPVVDPPASSSNFSAMAAPGGAISTIDLGNNTGGGIGDTSFTNSLNTFSNNNLPTQGDGSSASAALNYVFLITDGLSDTPGCLPTGHCTGALSSSLCSQLKTNATVGVIYTTYNPIFYNQNNQSPPYNTNYNLTVAPYVNQIPLNLQACSSGARYYYEASDGPAITKGIEALFNSSAMQARLSQ